MQQDETVEIGNQFQSAFARLFEGQIQQLVEESRTEALAQAKLIIRKNALVNVLEAFADNTGLEELRPQTNINLPTNSSVEAEPAQTEQIVPAVESLDEAVDAFTVDESEDTDSYELFTLDDPLVSDEPQSDELPLSGNLPSEGLLPGGFDDDFLTDVEGVFDVKPLPAKKEKKPKVEQANPNSLNAPSLELNGRLLEEIEAIQEQIRRNEQLLNQIKPFVQPDKPQEE